MLATAAGYEFDVDRGPDWLWIRIRSVETGSSPAASLAEQLKELVENHFIYRIVLELHRVPELSSQLIGELVQLIDTSRSTTACYGFAGSRRRAVRCWRCAVWMTSASRMKRVRRPFSAVARRACRDRPQKICEYRLRSPTNFQFVGDLLDARHAADRFLGHLLLIIRPHRAAKRHAAFAGLETQRSGGDVGILFHRAMHAVFQGTDVDHYNKRRGFGGLSGGDDPGNCP